MVCKSYLLPYLILNSCTFLKTFKRLINTWNSQTKPKKVKVLDQLKQNVHAKITLQPGNTWEKTAAILNPFANSLLNLKKSNNEKLSLSIIKPHVKLGHGEASKGLIYGPKTRSICSPSFHFQVLDTKSKPFTSNKSNTTVGFCKRPLIVKTGFIKKNKLDQATYISPIPLGVSGITCSYSQIIRLIYNWKVVTQR